MASHKTNNSSTTSKAKKRQLWRPIVLLTVIIVVLILSRVFGLDKRLGELRNWIDSLGLWGPGVFILLYIGAVIAGIPGSAITVAAGALFGSILGIILVSISSTIGASFAFLIARYFARDAVANWLSTKEKFKRLDRLTENQGAIIVAITRLIPVFPFNLLNYGFGLTRVRFWTYVFWSWLCMLPGTVLYVVGTDAVISGIAQGRIPWALIVIVIVVGAVLIMLTRYARRKLKEDETYTKVEDVSEEEE